MKNCQIQLNNYLGCDLKQLRESPKKFNSSENLLVIFNRLNFGDI